MDKFTLAMGSHPYSMPRPANRPRTIAQISNCRESGGREKESEPGDNVEINYNDRRRYSPEIYGVSALSGGDYIYILCPN